MRGGVGVGAFVLGADGAVGRAGAVRGGVVVVAGRAVVAERGVFCAVVVGRAVDARTPVDLVADGVADTVLVTGALVAGAFGAGDLTIGVFVAVVFLTAGRSLSPIGTTRKGGAADCASAAAPPTAMRPATQ